MGFPVAAAIGLGSTLLGAFGRNKQKKAQEKAAKAQSDAQFKQSQLNREARGKQHSTNEKSRLATLRSLIAIAGQRGIKGIDMASLDPALFEERPFNEAEVVAPPTESGRSGLGDFLSGAGDVGLAVGDFMSQEQARKKREAETEKLLCILNPASCGGSATGRPAGVQGDVVGIGGGNA